MPQQNSKVLSQDFIDLKTKVKAEMTRRGMTTYTSTSYDYSTQPGTNSTVLIEHIDKNLEPMRAINHEGLPELGEKAITAEDMNTLDAKIQLWATTGKYQKSTNDCTGACTGLCMSCTGTCTNGCSNCGGSCSTNCSGCSGDCQGTCSGLCEGTCDTGCQGTCKGGCEDQCSTACTGGCSASCTGGCDNGCTGCDVSSGQHCTNGHVGSGHGGSGCSTCTCSCGRSCEDCSACTSCTSGCWGCSGGAQGRTKAP